VALHGRTRTTLWGLVRPAGATAALDGGARNPSNNTSSGYQKETEIVGNIAQNAGGVAKNTGGYTTRQSNKSDSGDGAIYGCRAKAGTESCVAANSLNNGDAFRFQATPSDAAVGQIRFGLDTAQPVDKPPFITNGTGLVKNLNADRVDGKSADDFLPAGSMLFATVAADGTIGAGRGVPAGEGDPVGDRRRRGAHRALRRRRHETRGHRDPTAVTPEPLVVGSDGKSIVVTEPTATTPIGFAPAGHLLRARTRGGGRCRRPGVTRASAGASRRRSRSSAPRRMRDTWIWETPSTSAISGCVRSRSKRRRSTVRSRALRQSTRPDRSARRSTAAKRSSS
jgi:hypothetical protein